MGCHTGSVTSRRMGAEMRLQRAIVHVCVCMCMYVCVCGGGGGRTTGVDGGVHPPALLRMRRPFAPLDPLTYCPLSPSRLGQPVHPHTPCPHTPTSSPSTSSTLKLIPAVLQRWAPPWTRLRGTRRPPQAAPRRPLPSLCLGRRTATARQVRGGGERLLPAR